MILKPAKLRGSVGKYLFGYLGILLLLHLLTVLLTRNNPELAASQQAVWFDMDLEYNVPTFSNALLLGSSAFLALVMTVKSKLIIQQVGWALFALLFGYLALDEALIIHEQLAEPTRQLLDIGNSNPLYHAWVVPAIFVVLVLASLILIIKRYFKQLKVFADVLKLIVILAGVVVFLEIIGTFVYPYPLAYRIFMVSLEEVFELSMAVILLLQLLGQHREA